MYKPYLRPKPTPPEKVEGKAVISHYICSTSDRVNHWEGYGEYDEEEYEEDEEGKDITEAYPARHKITFAEVMEKLPHDVDIKDVYFTASFSDDYLCIHAHYDEVVDKHEKNMRKYEQDLKKWNEEKKYYDQQLAAYEKELKEELARIKKK